MESGDLGPVLKIEERCFTHPWSGEGFLAELSRGASRCLVIEKLVENQGNNRTAIDRKKEIAGFLLAWRVADELHITNLAVDPDHRRNGLALRMLSGLLDEEAGEGAAWCTLEVRASNRAARSLYEGLGFAELGIRSRYYPDGEDAVVLGVEL